MAGLRGNQAWYASGRQTVKGTPATATDRMPFSGGNLSPTSSRAQLSETDSDRREGATYVQMTSVEGSPEHYLRGQSAHHDFESVLGVASPSGTTNYTHTITPSGAALPYYTMWKMLGNTLWERYLDVMVSELTLSADAGSPVTVSRSVMGRSSTRLTADPALTPVLNGSLGTVDHSVYTMNDATITLGGAATSLIGAFELTIANNVSMQQTDDSVPYDVVPGIFSVTLGFDLIFETLDEYNKFHYGASAGTTQSSTIVTTSASIVFSKGANNEVGFTIPSLAYEEFPVEPDPGGDPIVVPVRARAQRSASPLITATVKNQVAT